MDEIFLLFIDVNVIVELQQNNFKTHFKHRIRVQIEPIKISGANR